MLYFSDSFYTIGGRNQYGDEDQWGFKKEFSSLDTIYRLDKKSWTWSEAGQLNSGRFNHGSMLVNKGCQHSDFKVSLLFSTPKYSQ